MQEIYWNVPYGIKRWIASLHARNMDRERYGIAYKEILGDIAEHDKWSQPQFSDYQHRELRSLIRHAADNVPYYRKLFYNNNIEPSRIKTVEDLKQIPVLEKETIRAAPEIFIDDTVDKGRLLKLHTSGTTGTPLNLYRDTWLNSAAFAYLDARWHGKCGMCRRFNKSVSLGGHLVVKPRRQKPPFWIYNHHWQQLYMSSYHLSSRYLGFYVEKLKTYKADYIEGYPSSIYAIARYIIDNQLEPIAFKACFTTAETLFDYQRETIKEAFDCRVYNQYGCGEMAVFAAECECGSMHLSPEIGIVEIVDDNDRPVTVGQSGQLVCTSLINRIQPFVRYRVGDIGAINANACPCGCPLPVLDHIEGRIDATLMTRDGRQIGRLDPVFKGAQGIAEAQIVQNDYDIFIIKIVPGNNYSNDDGLNVASNLSNYLGGVDVSVELVKFIERTKSGKFVAIVCNMSNERI